MVTTYCHGLVSAIKLNLEPTEQIISGTVEGPVESVYEGLKYKLRLEFPAGMISFNLISFTHCLLTGYIALLQSAILSFFGLDYLSSVTAAEDEPLADA